MSNYAISLKRSSALLVALSFVAVLLAVNFTAIFGGQAGAAQFASRSLTLASTRAGNLGAATAADSETNGADTTHTFRFNIPSTTSLQAIRFQYCTTAIGTCTAPTGLDVDTPTIVTQTVNNIAWSSAWATGTSTASVINLTNTGAAPLLAGHTAVFSLNNLTNPTTEGSFFVRMYTYSDAFTTVVDEGTVASSIVDGIAITSKVAETLGFSTKGLAPNSAIETENAEACDPLVGTGAIQLGNPSNEYTLSINAAYDAWSAFRLYTNSAAGTVVQYEGATLTKGLDNIDAIGGTPEDSQLGNEQFGLGIDTTGNGSTMTGDYDTTFGGTGQLDLITGYDNADGSITNGGDAEFAFVADTPTTIATSATNDFYVGCDTAVVRYMANISPLTPAGTYTTTVVYSAVPTY